MSRTTDTAPETENAEEVERDGLLRQEDDLIAIFAGRIKNLKTEVARVELPRLPLTIRLKRPTTEDEDLIQKRSARKQTVRQYGHIVVKEEQDQRALVAWTIYLCTVKEDREAIWDNEKLWGDLPVGDGPEFIDRVLLPGEKLQMMETLATLQGAAPEEEIPLAKS